MAHQKQPETTNAPDSHLSGISNQLQECIKTIKYADERYKNDPIQELIPEDMRDEYLKINNFPHAQKWNTLCEGLEACSMSRKEADLLDSGLNSILRAFKEWEDRFTALTSAEGVVTVDEVMDMWLFGRIIVPMLGRPGLLLEQVQTFVDKVDAEVEEQTRDFDLGGEVKDESHTE